MPAIHPVPTEFNCTIAGAVAGLLMYTAAVTRQYGHDAAVTMTRKIIGIGLFLCWLVSAGALASPIYSQLVVFGDSLSDSGNNAVLFDRFFGGARTSVPLQPPGIIPVAPYASNRYSNGPVCVKYFADALGLEARASLLGGTNYAYGGARVAEPVSLAPRCHYPARSRNFSPLPGAGSPRAPYT